LLEVLALLIELRKIIFFILDFLVMIVKMLIEYFLL
jgi:hypothetical protein